MIIVFRTIFIGVKELYIYIILQTASITLITSAKSAKRSLIVWLNVWLNVCVCVCVCVCEYMGINNSKHKKVFKKTINLIAI